MKLPKKRRGRPSNIPPSVKSSIFLPGLMDVQVRRAAKENRLSFNQEILRRLTQSFGDKS